MSPNDPTLSRPYMPKDYGIKDATEGTGLLPWSRACEQLEKSRNYWVITARPDGRPHAMPVWGLWFEDAFYFGTGANTVNGRNIAANPRIVMHLESGDDVVILEGTVEEVKDRDLLARLDKPYHVKYDFHMIDENGNNYMPVYTLKHHLAFAWLEKDFTGSPTRYQFT